MHTRKNVSKRFAPKNTQNGFTQVQKSINENSICCVCCVFFLQASSSNSSVTELPIWAQVLAGAGAFVGTVILMYLTCICADCCFDQKTKTTKRKIKSASSKGGVSQIGLGKV